MDPDWNGFVQPSMGGFMDLDDDVGDYGFGVSAFSGASSRKREREDDLYEMQQNYNYFASINGNNRHTTTSNSNVNNNNGGASSDGRTFGQQQQPPQQSYFPSNQQFHQYASPQWSFMNAVNGIQIKQEPLDYDNGNNTHTATNTNTNNVNNNYISNVNNDEEEFDFDGTLGYSREQLLRVSMPNNVRISSNPPTPSSPTSYQTMSQQQQPPPPAQTQLQLQAQTYMQPQQPVLKHEHQPNNTTNVSAKSHPTDAIYIEVEPQPPSEVRTRTPSEIRVFTAGVRLHGAWKGRVTSVVATLRYSSLPNAGGDGDDVDDELRSDLLGGHTTVQVNRSQYVLFENLSMSESSAKHKEREFCIEFVALGADGKEVARVRSTPFYAYSHKKVLQRRGSIKLRAVSKHYARLNGGEEMHVIGTPFIQGPALRIVVRTQHGDVSVKPEWYSDSVLFFQTPAYPLQSSELSRLPPNVELPVELYVSNDGGRTLSSPLQFTYVAEGSARSRY